MEYRTAFITGASSGIGTALARTLARSGVEVGLAARREDELERVADAIRADGGKARVYPLDVSDAGRVTEVIQQADDELGGLELVVANAGVSRGRWSGKLTWSECETMIDVNVRGAVATLVAVLPRMVERKRGHLVGISSIAQYRGLPKYAVYSASKAFLSTFLEGIRIDLQGVGVAVTDIRPGYVRTGMNQDSKQSMPFIMSAEKAADEIVGAILGRRAVCAFPLPVAAAMRSATMIPAGVYGRLVRTFTGAR